MHIKMKKIVVSICCVVLGLMMFEYANAQQELQSDITKQLQGFAGKKGAGLGEAQDPRLIVANLIKVSLSIVGTIAVVFGIAGGFIVMTSGGNEEKVGSGKKILFYSVVGLSIILGAYSIVYAIYVGIYGSLQNPMLPGQEGVPQNDLDLYED